VSRRAKVEHLLDRVGWAWNTGLSLLLDLAVLEEEGA
jgi:hypothetical protein